MSTLDLSQLTAADMGNPALTAQDLADITAARADLHPYVRRTRRCILRLPSG